MPKMSKRGRERERIPDHTSKRVPKETMNRLVKLGADTFTYAVRDRLINDSFTHGDDFRELLRRIGASLIARSRYDKDAVREAERIDPETDRNLDGGDED